ncbi:hypothetical protein LG296_21035 (plasmid) [Ureibacillus chungkukjangi]|uniref:ABC transporter substrate-binding protein n=1 Tax=Ureibacillus chungkukjangi TaxID=1202712 RepID=UPI00384DF1A0
MNRLRCKKKDKSKVSIEIDSQPISINPLKTLDYNGKLICNTLYEPLKHGVNCKIISNDCLNEYTIEIFQDYFESKITANNFVQAILLHLNKQYKSPYIKDFLQIKNAILYLMGEKDINTLGIAIISKYSFRIELERTCSYFLNILESPFLIPINGQNKPINNGPYTISDISNKEINLIRNKNYFINDVSNVKNINFLLNNNIKESVDLYKNHYLDITCHTQFHHEFLHLDCYDDFERLNSNLFFYLDIRNKVVFDLLSKDGTQLSIPESLKRILKPISSYIGERNIWNVNTKLDNLYKDLFLNSTGDK